jgi:formylglycine-generating enzyme required for sulfatase activity
VTISKPFLLGATEVTIGQFKKFVAAAGYKTEAEGTGGGSPTFRNPGYSVTDESPAVMITWNEATAYCGWLSKQDGVTYRLPTEAEWEYACRAGTTTQFFTGDDETKLAEFAWYGPNADKMVAVGTRLPNTWALYDMHGNVWEWCRDFYEDAAYATESSVDPQGPAAGSRHPMRGGSWNNDAVSCRSAYRNQSVAAHRSNNIGFRVVREIALPSNAADASR